MTVRAGEAVDLGVFELPAPRRWIETHGLVRRSGGRPVGQTSVFLKADPERFVATTLTDEQGRFTFTGYDGFSYQVSVQESRQAPVLAGPVSFVAAAGGDVVELVIREMP